MRDVSRHYTRKLIFNTRYFEKGSVDGGPGSEEVEHVNAIFTLLKYTYAFCASHNVPWLRVFDLDGQKREVQKGMRTMEKYHGSMVEERMKQWKNGEKSIEEDLLDVMISLKDDIDTPTLTMKEIL